MNTVQAQRLATYYLAGRLYRRRPRTVLFSPTLRCNLRCLHCGIWKNKADVPTEVDPSSWSGLLGDPLFAEVDSLWIGGGEPTLRDDLADYYRAGWMCLPRLTRLGLITNGFLAGRALETVDRLMEAIPPSIIQLYVHLSIDGPPSMHDAIRGVPNAFRQMERTLEGLRERRARDGRLVPLLNCVIQPDNLEGLGEVEAFARSRAVPLTFNLLSLTEGFYCNTENADRLAFANGARGKAMEFLRERIDATPWPLKGHYRNVVGVLGGRGRSYRCVAMESTFHIDGDGRVWACPASSEITVGHWPRTPAAELWNGSAFRRVRQRVRREFCNECGLSCSIGDGMNLAEWLDGPS